MRSQRSTRRFELYLPKMEHQPCDGMPRDFLPLDPYGPNPKPTGRQSHRMMMSKVRDPCRQRIDGRSGEVTQIHFLDPSRTTCRLGPSNPRRLSTPRASAHPTPPGRSSIVTCASGSSQPVALSGPHPPQTHPIISSPIRMADQPLALQQASLSIAMHRAAVVSHPSRVQMSNYSFYAGSPKERSPSDTDFIPHITHRGAGG